MTPKEAVENGMQFAVDSKVGGIQCDHDTPEGVVAFLRFAIKATDIDDPYTIGLRNGMRMAISLITGEDPEFESCREE